MQIVPVDTVKPGMILAKPICRKSDGVVLLQENIEFNQTVAVTYISRLKCLVKVTSGPNEGEIFNLYQRPELSVTQVY